MALATAEIVDELVILLEGLTGMGAVQIGAPSAISTAVGAWVSLGSQQTQRVAQGVMERETRLLVMLVYRLDKNSSTAEVALMGVVDAFLEAIFADLTRGGTVEATSVDTSAADEPTYQLWAGMEYREYPLIVSVIQRTAFTVQGV
jgi:hypothetical protein